MEQVKMDVRDLLRGYIPTLIEYAHLEDKVDTYTEWDIKEDNCDITFTAKNNLCKVGYYGVDITDNIVKFIPFISTRNSECECFEPIGFEPRAVDLKSGEVFVLKPYEVINNSIDLLYKVYPKELKENLMVMSSELPLLQSANNFSKQLTNHILLLLQAVGLNKNDDSTVFTFLDRMDTLIYDIDVYNICEFLEYAGYYSNSTELVKYIMNKSK